ncbi:hypothetical protein [Enterococcus asini]|uniref:hypothetical protein n=1 Tax=Enterococcus asini TaxID=57732 RepID=UPI00288D2A38|nr:hypothetical protein [Enterococcus asini]MDT2744375.1 hypothetical protein [Enterococcus asini]
MKKKQKQKLLNQFRLSFENTRQQLFRTLEEKANELYDLEIGVRLNPKNAKEMLIENSKATENPVLTVPIDDSFTTIIKRLQKKEAGLLEQFSTNLTQEIANYWYHPVKTEETATTEEASTTEPKAEKEAVAPKETPVKEDAKAVETTTDASAATVEGEMTYAAFDEAIKGFPKFFTEKDDTTVSVKEKTAKEDRLLATISVTEVGQFEIEKALERKYKVKTEVIPLIEALAQTPLANR